ncbi:MAG: 50S ribosomal protein L18 [bacterium]|nr:50S ribosomal protein L18 [bacterium]
MKKNTKKIKRKLRTRSKIFGTKDRLRLSVFRSNNFIYAQIIDDKAGKTLIGVSEKSLEKKEGNKIEKAKELGVTIAKKALEQKIKKVVFDKGAYAFHGRIKALAEGAREGGLEF